MGTTIEFYSEGDGKGAVVTENNPLPVVITSATLEVIMGYLQPNTGYEPLVIDWQAVVIGDFPFPSTTLDTLRKVMINNNHDTQSLKVKYGDGGNVVVIVQPKSTVVLDFPASTDLYADVTDLTAIQGSQSVVYIGIA